LKFVAINFHKLLSAEAIKEVSLDALNKQATAATAAVNRDEGREKDGAEKFVAGI
jgi:hypothetical protein